MSSRTLDPAGASPTTFAFRVTTLREPTSCPCGVQLSAGQRAARYLFTRVLRCLRCAQDFSLTDRPDGWPYAAATPRPRRYRLLNAFLDDDLYESSGRAGRSHRKRAVRRTR